VPHPGEPPLAGGADGEPPAELFARALARAGGEVVHLAGPEQAAAWVRGFARSFSSAAVSGRVPPALRPPVPEVEPERAELGVSVAVAGAAATGSLVLTSAEGRGVQLLPPTHLVWVEARSIERELAQALARAREAELPAALALHSGPSKSADIGRIVVTGVHGPGRLVAAVAAFGLSEVW
jgi:L-lactate dehydrogenase complex protein LldG